MRKNRLWLLLITLGLVLSLTACGGIIDKVKEKAVEKAVELAATAEEVIEPTPPEEERKETRPEEGLPTSDVAGEDIPDIPRYPGSVRTYYMAINGSKVIEYVAEAEVGEVLNFYKKELPANGWTITTTMVMEEAHLIMVEKEGKTATVICAPSDGHTGITVQVE